MRVRCLYGWKILRRMGIEAITLYPFVIFSCRRDEVAERLCRHELEHVYQVERSGWLKFYLSYLRSYFGFRLAGLSHHEAYMKIPQEVEARRCETLALVENEKEIFSAPRPANRNS